MSLDKIAGKWAVDPRPKCLHQLSFVIKQLFPFAFDKVCLPRIWRRINGQPLHEQYSLSIGSGCLSKDWIISNLPSGTAWDLAHRCISLHWRSWGTQKLPQQSHSSSGPLPPAAFPRWAWCNPPCSGSCDLHTHTQTPTANLWLVNYLRHRAGRGCTFVLNNDARVHFWVDTVHQDHESEMLINLEHCKPYQHRVYMSFRLILGN